MELTVILKRRQILCLFTEIVFVACMSYKEGICSFFRSSLFNYILSANKETCRVMTFNSTVFFIFFFGLVRVALAV